MALKLLAGLLPAFWLVLVLLGKGGFVHLLLLGGIGVASAEIVTFFRSRMISHNPAN